MPTLKATRAKLAPTCVLVMVILALLLSGHPNTLQALEEPEYVWALVSTSTNPSGTRLENYGGGRHQDWYETPHYEGKHLTYAHSEVFCQISDRHVYVGIEYHDVTFEATRKQMPPPVLIPDEPVVLTAELSHIGGVREGAVGPWIEFNYYSNFVVVPNYNFMYAPFDPSFGGGTTATFTVDVRQPQFPGHEIDIGSDVRGHAPCLVIWTYRAVTRSEAEAMHPDWAGGSGDGAEDGTSGTGETDIGTGDATSDTGETGTGTGDATSDTGETGTGTGDGTSDTGETGTGTGDATSDTGETGTGTGDGTSDTGETGTGQTGTGTGDSGSGQVPLVPVVPGGICGGYQGITAASTVPGADFAPPPYGDLAEPAPVGAMTLQAGQARVPQGAVVHVPVFLINGASVANMNFNLLYDSTVARSDGDLAQGWLLAQSLFEYNTSETNRIRAGFAQQAGINGTGPVAYVPFRAVGPPGSRTGLCLEVTTLNDPNGTVLPIDRIHGLIEIVNADGSGISGEGSGILQGDCTLDGRLDERDAACALQMSVNLRPPQPWMDMDGSGDVTSRDATIILQQANVSRAGP